MDKGQKMTNPPENALLPDEIWVYLDRVGRKVICGKNDPVHPDAIKYTRAQPPALPDAPARGGEEYYYDCYKCDKRLSTENLMIVDHPEEVPPRDNVRTCRTCLTDNVGADSYTLIQSSQREVTGEESILKEIVEEAKTSHSGSRATGHDADEWQDYVEIPKSLIDKALAIISGKEG